MAKKENKVPVWFDKEINNSDTSKEDIEELEDLLKEYR